MNSYSERVLYDRYSIKDPEATLKVGDIVVVTQEEKDPYTGKMRDTRKVGVVQSADGQDTFDVALKHEVQKEGAEAKILTDVPRHLLEYVVERDMDPICVRLSDGIIRDEPENEEFKKAIYDVTSKMEFIPAGRILAGLGRDQSFDLTLFNCYVFSIPADSREAIGTHWLRLLNTFATGGGVGWNLSVLRPRGSLVKKVNGRSSGAVSWGEQFSQVTGAVEQGGSRRGASLQGMWCWHPDIEEFIEAKSLFDKGKTRDGEWIDIQGKLMTNSNVSVLISDDFMEAVEYNSEWDLVFPDTSYPNYDETWDGDLWKWKRDGKPVIVYKTVNARELWDKIVHHAWESGEPGLLFLERANKMSNSYYYDRISCTNPCVTADTPVFTHEGILTVADLRDEDFFAPQDKRMEDGDEPNSDPRAKAFFSSGVKPVYRLQTKEGYHLRCTDNHRVMTSDGWKRADELEEDDLLHIHHCTNGSFGEEGSPELGSVLGWLVADGHITGETAVLDFYDKKKELADFFASKTLTVVAGTEKNKREYSVSPVFVEAKDKYTFKSERLFRVLREYGITADNLKSVPTVVRRGTEQMQKTFLTALFTADGTFNDCGDKGASVRLDSSVPELLEGVQLLLLNFGIASKIYWERREAGYRKLPDGKGGVKEYWCEADHTLAISKRNMVNFRDEIGFLLPYKDEALSRYLDRLVRGPYKETFTARFESLTPDGEEEVFDTSVYHTNAYVSGGLVSHNCGEQPLPTNAVCNLSHLNLARFIKPEKETLQFPDKERHATDAWKMMNVKRLKEVIHLGVRFLDNAIDLNKYHDPATKEQQMKERRIGLGVMGLGELLMRLGLGYGSHEGLKFTDTLFEFISTQSYLASVELAKERGAFTAFDADQFIHSGFMRNHVPRVVNAVRKHGIRNVTLNTIAPTGSVSTLADTTTGIEPYFAFKWTATTKIGTADEKMSVLESIIDRFGEEEEDWPSYVVTAQRGINTAQHVKMMGMAQRWIDSSISKTVNLPKGSSVEDVSNAYIAMWRQGCKGGTVYVDESRDEQVLHVEGSGKEKSTHRQKDNIVVKVVEKNPESILRPALASGIGPTYSVQTPIGSVHVTFRCDPDSGEPYDFFMNAGKGEMAANAQAIARLISMILRWPNNTEISQKGRLDIIRLQLYKIPGLRQTGVGPDAINSFPDAVSWAMDKFLGAKYQLAGVPFGMKPLEEAMAVLRSHDVPQKVLKELFLDNGNQKPEEERESETEEATFKQAEEDFSVVEDTDRYNKDICVNCGNLGWVRRPGKCPFCVNCGYKEC